MISLLSTPTTIFQFLLNFLQLPIYIQFPFMSFPFLLLFSIFVVGRSDCVHDMFSSDAPKHFYDDLTHRRLLQAPQNGRIRIFVDYTQVSVGGKTQINTIKRATNISANYFYNVLKLNRLQRLYYPSDVSRKCNVLTVPEQYVSEGTIGDYGVICGNQKNQKAVYVAKSTACAYLQSNKRPFWGIIIWNNAFLKYDQEGFQQILFVGLHELTHILGFSAVMYDIYPSGNPLRQSQKGDYYLYSEEIAQEIKDYFGCPNPQGLLLEDQDGTLIPSHWELKVMGNQYMIASNKKGSFVSLLTLLLLKSTGWYTSVNLSYAEPTVWGKGKGCQIFDVDNCVGEELCQDSEFHCDWDGTAIGRCSVSPYSGTCKVVKYFSNTICIDENYELKNLNSKLNALERGGHSSRCFKSDYRETGLKPTKLNHRCYLSICSVSGKYLYLLVGSYVLVCNKPGFNITAPPGLEGTLECPDDFDKYCANKKTCAYHCNKNGACIDGQCLCTGSLELTASCLDVSILKAPIGSSGGLLKSLNNKVEGLSMNGDGTIKKSQKSYQPKQSNIIKQYSINSFCLEGSVFDEIFGECLLCSYVYGCQECNNQGCIVCDDGRTPRNGRC